MTTAPWSAAQLELLTRVQASAADAGYEVTPRDDGFDLERDLTDETRTARASSRKRELERRVAHEVRFGADDTFSITDTDRRTRVGSGGTARQASRSFARGRQVGAGGSITFSLEGGRLRRTSSTGYRTDTGRRLVEDAAAELGLTQRRGTAERVGLAAAVLVAAATVVAVLVLLGVLLL